MALRVSVRLLSNDEAYILDRIKPGTLAAELNPARAFSFLATGVNAMAVAVSAGDIVAYGCGTVIMRPDRADLFRVTAIRTHPDYRRRGIGSRIVESLADYAFDRGCRSVEIDVDCEDAGFLAFCETLPRPVRRDKTTFSIRESVGF